MKYIENSMETYEQSKADGYCSQILTGIDNNQRICYTLKNMTGSAKQIDWAATIKTNWLTEIIKNQATGIVKGVVSKEQAIANIGKVAEKLETLTEAHKIIDMRNMVTMAVVQQIMRG